MRRTFYLFRQWQFNLLLVLAITTGAAWGDSPALPPEGARRVVLFEAYELAACLGAWDRVAGISRYAYDNDLLQRLVPHLRQIPSPGTGFDVNVEALHALKPDLVVTWSRKPETIEFLKRQGFAVLSIYHENLGDLRRDLLRLGALLGKEARAREVVGLMDRHLEKIRERVAPLVRQGPPRVIWTWGKPTIITGRLGVVQELIEVAGGKNLGDNLETLNKELSMETMVALNPQVVLIWGSAKYTQDDLLNDPKWQTIRAIKDRRVFKAGRASTWSPRIVALAWWMARCFYPEAISDKEALAGMDQFYRECFGISHEERR